MAKPASTTTEPVKDTTALDAARAARSKAAAEKKATVKAEKLKAKEADAAATAKEVAKCEPLLLKLEKSEKKTRAELTKSAVIRHLESSGIGIGDIARFLGMKYSDVYSIHWGSKKRAEKAAERAKNKPAAAAPAGA